MTIDTFTGSGSVPASPVGDATRTGCRRHRFILGEGAGEATIIKFDEGDRITLTGGLTFSNLNISQSGGDTLISAGADLLATLKYTQSSTITSGIFA